MYTYVEIKNSFNIFTTMFMAVLFTIVKSQKLPKCPLTDKHRKKRCYITPWNFCYKDMKWNKPPVVKRQI